MQQDHTADNDNDSATAWMAAGNCRNYPPAVFFPSDGVGVDRARWALRSLPYLRDRFTLTDLLLLAGRWDDALAHRPVHRSVW